MKLVVGLGNPGKEYENTRHNAGFMALDLVARHFGFGPFRLSSKHHAVLAEGQIGNQRVLLAKPQTYMNLSGQAVRSLTQFHKIPLFDVTVVYDEAALPLGTVRLRPDGSAGGHNGIKSLIQELGSDPFVRLRLGIGPQPDRMALENYVLGTFTAREKQTLQETLNRLPEILETLFENGVVAAMAEFNGTTGTP